MKGKFTVQLKTMNTQDRQHPSWNASASERRAYQKTPRIYVWVEDPNKLLPETDDWWKDVLAAPVVREFVKQALTAMGLPEDSKTYFSRKAGCSCGCSPGYVVSEPATWVSRDAFVTLEVVEFARTPVRTFSGELIKFEGPGWYRLETQWSAEEGEVKQYLKVKAISHEIKSPMVYVELSDTVMS